MGVRKKWGIFRYHEKTGKNMISSDKVYLLALLVLYLVEVSSRFKSRNPYLRKFPDSLFLVIRII